MFVNKRIMILVSVVVALVMLGLGIGLVYVVSALGQANATITSTTNAHATATALATSTPKAPRRVNGVIRSLGTSSFTISVDKGKRTVTVNVNNSTKYTHNGQSASFSDLQVGETVAIMGTVDTSASTVQATRVVISPQAKATGTPTPTPTATP